MILYELEKFPKKLESKIIEDSKKDFNPITSYTLVNGIVENYFYKKLNVEKIKSRYSGDYKKLLVNYYMRLKKYFKCNELICLIESDSDLFEVQKKIDKNQILCDNRAISFLEIRYIFNVVLDEISRLEYSREDDLGVDSSIWNFTKEGILFDFDPPKIYTNDTMFAKIGDVDHADRIYYRSFNHIGMRTNALATLILGNKNWNFSISDLPYNYVNLLLDDLLSSIDDKDKLEMLKNELYSVSDMQLFTNHPVNIIKKEMKRNG